MTERKPIDDDLLVRLHHGTAAERAELEALAARDPDIRARLTDWQRQDAAIRALYGPVAEEPVPHRQLRLFDRPARRWPRVSRIAATIGLIALGAAGGWFAARLAQPPARGADLVAEALQTHATYSVEVAHPVEVPATDEAHMIRWLSKRLGHRIAPPDLRGFGFQLIGGRVVPSATGAAAVMMYEDDIGRRVTLFVTRESGQAETEFRYSGNGAARGFWWIEDGLGCAVVGDLPVDTLRAISVSAYHDLIDA